MRSYAAFIQPRCRNVVELGCGDGSTGQEFKRIQPMCRYTGVEEDETRARQACSCLDEVICEGFARFDLRSLVGEKPDCIVLHSSFAAGSTLKLRVAELVAGLAEDGQFLLVLENPGYLRTALAVLQGGSAVQGAELGLQEAVGLLQKAGLQPDKAVAQYDSADDAFRKQADTQVLVKFLQEQGRLQGNIWARQFVICAVKRACLPERLLLQAMLGEARVTAQIRVKEPNSFFITEPGVTQHVEALTADLRLGAAYPQKVLLRQRCRSTDYENFVRDLDMTVQAGYVLVAELDDHPGLWEEDYARTRYVDFAGCHAIQVSTPALAEYIRQFNPHVRVFENELRQLPEPRVYKEGAPVTIFFGALNRTKDWQEIMPQLNALLHKYGERVQVRVIFDREFYEALETEHKELLGQEYPDGYVPYEVYGQILHTADISLLPLRNTAFNRMKSDLKFIESAGHGAVVLASPTVYASSVQDGLTGVLYHSPKEFSAKLAELIERPERRRIIARSAYLYVKENRLLSQHYEERLEWYRSLAQRQPELTAELRERLCRNGRV